MLSKICYNDEPVLEVGAWRVLCPNMYGKKYKGINNPILIHKCPKHINTDIDGNETPSDEWRNTMVPDRSTGNPQCARCADPVPDEIQGLLAMYYMDEPNIPDTACNGGS